MKSFRIVLVLLAAAAANLVGPRSASAADNSPATPPTVVPQGRDHHHESDLTRDFRGIPDNVKTLLMTFDQTRDRYLQQQRLLLIKMRHAVTPDEQDQIRQLLQSNRQDFLTELKSFRDELRTDLQALKGKIGHGEFGRIIDAAHDVTTENGHRHRGQ